MILTQSSLRGTQCVAALRRALLSQITFGSLLGRPGRSLVVSKAGQPKTGGWFSSLFCSLTSGFEGRETQTAESWRISSSEILVRDLKQDSGDILRFSHHHDVCREIGVGQSVKVPVTQKSLE
jgi:hypothetical protein